MDVRILGPLEVRSKQDQPVPVRGARQRAVLAMLALQVNQVVSTNFLIDGLWGQTPPATAAGTLQVYMSRLRTALRAGSEDGVDALVRRRSWGYLLELDLDRVDLYRFQRLTREALQLATTAPAPAAQLLGQGLELWCGPPLVEFSMLPFAQTEIPRLEEARLNALTAKVDIDLMLGRHAQLVGELEALVARHPLREGLHGQLMLALYRSGRQSHALAAYRRARDQLAEDLGVDPGRALQDLEAGILVHDPGLDWPPPPAGVESSPAGLPRVLPGAQAVSGGGMHRFAAVWNGPPRNPHFTGRGALLAALRGRFTTGEHTPVVQALYGLGGVGKTQLAIEYAHRFAADYDVVWWIDAQLPVLIADQLADLATGIGLHSDGTVHLSTQRVLTELGRRSRWLLIFDNAEHPDDIAGYQPPGSGHVLVTSRFPGWGAMGGRIEVDVFSRSETTALLRGRLPEMSDDLADKLAAELGDLPLAAAQAAGYLEQTALTPENYLRRFHERRTRLLTDGDVLGYHGRIDTTWSLSLDRLRDTDPSAVALLEMAAFLAPEPIELSLFTDHPVVLTEPLRTDIVANPHTLDEAVDAMVGFSLIRRHQDGFQLHRLVQLVIRHHLSADRHDAVAAQVVALLAAAFPGNLNNPAHWVAYSRLAPHVLAIGTFGDHHDGFRQLVLATVAYLRLWGDIQASQLIADQLFERWRDLLGPDHPDTITAAAHLSSTLDWLSDHEKARTLGEDTWNRARQVLGPDHPVTLRLATNRTFALAWTGYSQQACQLGRESLDRAARVLGPDSPDTLRLAASLATALAWQGQADQARILGQTTLERSRKALGPDHPVTLNAAAHVALAGARLGDTTADRSGEEETLHRSRQILGPDHPTTLTLAVSLTFIAAASGDPGQARVLGEDTLNRSRARLGPDHLVTLASAAVLAMARAELDQNEQAQARAKETLNRSRERLGPDHFITLIAAAALTTALARRGDADQAHYLGQDTLSRSRQHLGPDHPITRSLTTTLSTPILGKS